MPDYYPPMFAPQQPAQDDKLSNLAMMLASLGAGISNAGANNQPFYAGIGPGALMYSHGMAEQRQRTDANAFRNWQIGLQDRALQDKEAETKAKREAGMKLAEALNPSSVPGMRPNTTPQMGPGDYGPAAAGGVNDNNIGNVRPVGSSTGFQQPPDFDSGVRLAVKTGQSYPAAFNNGQPMTLPQIGARWAPKGDGANDPDQWAVNVSQYSGLPLNQPIDLSNPQVAAQFARGVHGAEKGAQAVRPVSDYLPAIQGGAGSPTIAQGDSVNATPAPMQTGTPQRGDLPALTPDILQSHDWRRTIPTDIRTMAQALFQGGKTDEAEKLLAPYRKPPDLDKDVVYVNGFPYRNTLGKKADSWRPMTADEIKLKLGPDARTDVPLQIQTNTGEIKPVRDMKEPAQKDISRLFKGPEIDALVADMSPADRAAYNAMLELGDQKGARGALQAQQQRIPPSLANVHGEDFLKTRSQEEQNLVRSLTDGRMTPTQLSKRNVDFNHILSLAMQTDPAYTPNDAGARQQFETKYMVSGLGGQTMQAANTVMPHLETWLKAQAALRNGDSQAINSFTNAVKKQFGDANVSSAEVASQLYGTEVAKAIRGAGPLNEKEELAAKAMTDGKVLSQPQAQAVGKTLTEMMMGRVHVLQETGRMHGISEDKVNGYMLPSSREVAERVLKGDLGGNAKPDGPPAPPAGFRLMTPGAAPAQQSLPLPPPPNGFRVVP